MVRKGSSVRVRQRALPAIRGFFGSAVMADRGCARPLRVQNASTWEGVVKRELPVSAGWRGWLTTSCRLYARARLMRANPGGRVGARLRRRVVGRDSAAQSRTWKGEQRLGRHAADLAPPIEGGAGLSAARPTWARARLPAAAPSPTGEAERRKPRARSRDGWRSPRAKRCQAGERTGRPRVWASVIMRWS